MFSEILSGSKKNPTLDDLKAAYKELAYKIQELEGQYETAITELNTAQQQSLGGIEVKALKDIGEKCGDLKSKIRAAEKGLETLKDMFARKMIKDSEERLAEIPEDLARLAKDRGALMRDFLKDYAKLLVFEEKLSGPNDSYRLRMRFNILEEPEMKILFDEVDKCRKNGAVKVADFYGKREILSKEEERLERFFDQDPHQEIERILAEVIS